MLLDSIAFAGGKLIYFEKLKLSLDLGVTRSVLTQCAGASVRPMANVLTMMVSGQREPAVAQYTSQAMQSVAVGTLKRGSLEDRSPFSKYHYSVAVLYEQLIRWQRAHHS